MKYSEFQLCNELNPKERCFRLRKYKEGTFTDLYHEHAPRYRMSEDSCHNFLKTLIACYIKYDNSSLLRCFMNSRGKNPSAINLCQVFVEYPEPGVIRKYFSHRDYSAWFDEVMLPSEFRQAI